MLALGIDTAGETGGISLVRDQEVIAEYNFRHKQDLTSRLMTNIAYLFEDTKTSRNDVDLVAVSIGPGSFTGLRIGAATAKTIAQGLGCAIVGISTLEATAYASLGACDGFVCSTLQAQKNEYYVGLFKQTAGSLETIALDLTLSNDKLISMLRDQTKATLVCGEAVTRLQGNLSDLGEMIHIAKPWQNISRASTVASLGIERALNGQTDDLLALVPKYTRPSQAEIRLAQGRIAWDKK